MAVNLPKIPRRLTITHQRIPETLKGLREYVQQLVLSINDQNDLIAAYLSGSQSVGVLADRPPTASQGAIYFATDGPTTYLFDGTNWNVV